MCDKNLIIDDDKYVRTLKLSKLHKSLDFIIFRIFYKDINVNSYKKSFFKINIQKHTESPEPKRFMYLRIFELFSKQYCKTSSRRL
jgi:hypothetical protein